MLKLTDLPLQVQQKWSDPLSWEIIIRVSLPSGSDLYVEKLHYLPGQEHFTYRWHDPHTGELSPGAFCSAAEAKADLERYCQQFSQEDNRC